MKKCNSICIAACAPPEEFFLMIIIISFQHNHHFQDLSQSSSKVQRYSLDFLQIGTKSKLVTILLTLSFIQNRTLRDSNPKLDNKTISMLHSYYLHIPKHTNEYLERKDHGIFWSFRLLAQLTFQGDDHRRWYSQFSSRSPWYSLMTKRLFRLMTARHELEGKKTKH